MKTKSLTVVACLIALFHILTSSVPKSTGSHISSTGAPGEETCNLSFCHADANINDGEGFTTLEFSGENNQYKLGEQYTFVLTIEDPERHRFGFQITGLDGTNESSIGEFKITEFNRTQTQYNGSSKRYYVTHKIGGTPEVSPGVGQWSFDWIAPDEDLGPITFYYAVNATNNNNNAMGDKLYLSSFEITPAEIFCNSVSDILPFSPQSTEISLTWSEAEGCKDGYQVRYRKSDNSEDWKVETTLNNLITLTGLTPDTNYDSEVACDCGGTLTWSDTFVLSTEPGTGIPEIAEANIKVYPNPFTQNPVLSFRDANINSSNAEVEIMNTMGQVVHVQRIDLSQKKEHILKTEHLPGAFYFLNISLLDAQGVKGQVYATKITKTN